MKLPESLKVTIDIRHKPGLSKRFDYSNRDAEYCIIYAGCPLCEEYIEVDCWGCPFNRFETNCEMGCQAWLRRVLASLGHEKVLFSCSHTTHVEWEGKHDAKVKQQLSALCAAAKELITWKENGKVKKGA